MNKAKSFIEFLNEDKKRFTKVADQYITTDYTPGWREKEGKGPQRYRNLANNNTLKTLNFIFDAGEEGRSTDEIKRFIYKMGGTSPGKDVRYRRDTSFDWKRPRDERFKVDFEGEREYDSVKDRGLGSTFLYGSDYYGKQTGILNAHCSKNEKGKWVLTDRKLINIFKMMDVDDEDDIELIQVLGLLD